MMVTMSAMMMMMAMMLAMMKLEVGRFPLISQEGSPGQSGNQRALVTIAHSTMLQNVHISDTYQLGCRVVDSSGYLSLHSTLESEALDSFPSIDTCRYLTLCEWLEL